MESVPVLGKKFISDHLMYEELIPAVQKALEEYSLDPAAQPVRTAVEVKSWNGTLLTMPSYSKFMDVLATKIVALYPDNDAVGLPTHQGSILLFNASNGSPLCIMDCEVITAMRTAAASVVATQAIISKTPKVLGIVGSGVQAESHIMALSHLYKFDEIKIWSRNPANTKKLCTKLPQFHMTPCASVKDAVEDADIVVTATHAVTPVLSGKWLKLGCHINCIGACRPTWREVDDECMRRSTVYVDSRESAVQESGDVILSKVEVYAEIGEILLGKKDAKTADFTIFKSLGIALEDAVAAKLVWDKMQKRITPK